MAPIFRRSKARDYQDQKAGGIAGMLRADSFRLRLVLFIAMSAIFFLFLKITERRIPHGLVPDSTEDTVRVPQVPATANRPR
jgi:hypothetical protein